MNKYFVHYYCNDEIHIVNEDNLDDKYLPYAMFLKYKEDHPESDTINHLGHICTRIRAYSVTEAIDIFRDKLRNPNNLEKPVDNAITHVKKKKEK